MLMHAAINNTKDIVPSATPDAKKALTFHASIVAWLTVGVLWLAASIFLVRMHQLSGNVQSVGNPLAPDRSSSDGLLSSAQDGIAFRVDGIHGGICWRGLCAAGSVAGNAAA